MGAYVNPLNETKEEFLEREGKEITVEDAILHNPGRYNHFAVCLIGNGSFTAAAILYDEGEIEAFTDSRDIRPKKYYLITKEKLLPISNLEFYLL